MSVLLEAEGIHAGYGDVEIVHDVSLTLDVGELVTIIGPNGAGKSTLLKAIFGMLHGTEGRVRIRGEDASGLKAPQMVARGVSYVPQTENVFPSLTVVENLKMGGFRRGADLGARITEVLDSFPVLAERPKERAGRLSGGQRQTLAIARALMLDPEVLFLDEPTASLSPLVREEIFERVQTIRRGGVGVLMVEQNAKEALAVSDRGVVLVQGRKLLEQSGQEMLNNEEVGRLFLGQVAETDEAGR
jgi:ABC-type branched-subunit amino acid transport system ATPase component